jgi:hypothetical protein
MRSLFRSALLALGLGVLGCGKPPDPPPAPTDVTLHVPGMN